MIDELASLIARHTAETKEQAPFATCVPGLLLIRAGSGRHPRHVLHDPALCVVAQGAKRTVFSHKTLDYATGQALLVTTTLPGVSRIRQASASVPYLGAVLELDVAVLRDVYLRMAPVSRPAAHGDGGAIVIDLDEPLLRCMLRALRLLDTPDAAAVLSAGVMQELCYWLLAGPRGGWLASIAAAGTPSARMTQALLRLRECYADGLSVDELAATAHLSRSAFHRQFKALTGMTPLAYQKRLRLLDARQQLASQETTAEAVAFRVGYQSPAQFSREYARMFGAPPRRDAALKLSAIRQAVAKEG